MLRFNVEAKKRKKARPINHIHEMITTVNSVSNIEPPYSTGRVNFFNPAIVVASEKDGPVFCNFDALNVSVILIDDQKFNFAEILPELTL